MLGMSGPWELLIVAMIALLLFGKRLPNVMMSLGQGISNFKKGLRDVTSDIEDSLPSRAEF